MSFFIILPLVGFSAGGASLLAWFLIMRKLDWDDE